MNKFTMDQHKKTGLELQLYHDTLQNIAVIITGAFPQRHRLQRAACIFNGGPGSPLHDLRTALENLLYQEQPAGDACRKIYFCNGSDNYNPPELLPGLPNVTACNFAALQTQRQNAENPPLTAFELTCLLRSLHHIESKLVVISTGLVEAYYPDVLPAEQVRPALAAITCVTLALFDELSRRAVMNNPEVSL